MFLNMVDNRVATVLENHGKSWNWQTKIQGLESPWIWVVPSLKILEFAKFFTFICHLKNNQNELFVTTGHNTFDVTVFENINRGSIFPHKQIL